jgi:ribosome biogenesis protein ENP2
VLLYDIRSSKPLLVKDHMYGLPIKKVVFTGSEEGAEEEKVLSMDSQVVRIWDRETGKPYTSIESTADFNDLVLYPRSGLLFLANEQPRMQVFYIPSLGPAPRWASFLDSLTEELEESRTATVYDDYKFVTREELQELGLDHLVGSPLLRAHLHGFFMDIRLYRKAASVKPSNSLENLKKDLIKKQIEAQREGRVKIESKMPKVNKDLFIKMKVSEEESKSKKSKKKEKSDLLEDDRFGALFTDERFEVDTNEEAFRLLNPVVSKLDNDKKKEFERKYGVKDNSDDENSGDSDVNMDESESDEESSDDEQEWTKEVKKEHRNIQKEKVAEKKLSKVRKQEQKFKKINDLAAKVNHTLSEVKPGDEFKNMSESIFKSHKKSKISLEDRLEAYNDDISNVVKTETGHVMTFQPERSRQSMRKEQEEREHREERRKVRRSAKALKKDKLPPRFWMGKRVR